MPQDRMPPPFDIRLAGYLDTFCDDTGITCELHVTDSSAEAEVIAALRDRVDGLTATSALDLDQSWYLLRVEVSRDSSRGGGFSGGALNAPPELTAPLRDLAHAAQVFLGKRNR